MIGDHWSLRRLEKSGKIRDHLTSIKTYIHEDIDDANCARQFDFIGRTYHHYMDAAMSSGCWNQTWHSSTEISDARAWSRTCKSHLKQFMTAASVNIHFTFAACKTPKYLKTWARWKRFYTTCTFDRNWLLNEWQNTICLLLYFHRFEIKWKDEWKHITESKWISYGRDKWAS